MSVTPEVSQLEISASKRVKPEKSLRMSVMAETSQSEMGPHVAVAAVGLALNAWTAVIREALVVKIQGSGGGGLGGGSGSEGVGGGDGGDGGGGEGGGIGGSGGDGGGGGGGGDGDGGGGEGGGNGGSGGDGGGGGCEGGDGGDGGAGDGGGLQPSFVSSPPPQAQHAPPPSRPSTAQTAKVPNAVLHPVPYTCTLVHRSTSLS